MSNLYFTISGLFLTVFLLITFLSKKRNNNIDNSVFLSMVSLSLIDCVLMVLIVCMGYDLFGNETLAKICNKMDFICYLFWCSLLFLYSYNAIRTKQHKVDVTKKVLKVINSILSLFIIFLPVELYKNGEVMYAYGPSTMFTYVSCIVYAVLVILLIIFNFKNIILKKIYPLFALVFLVGAAAFAYKLNPTILIIPAIISFLNLILYFAIENPDAKLLKQMAAAKEEAEKANRAKSDFLSSMSHEIRTPLNAIVGFSEDIQSHKDTLDPVVLEDSNYIIEASHTLLEIVGNILDINKIESEKMEIVNEVYHPYKLIKNLATLNATRIGTKSIDFRIDICEDLPYELYGDKLHIKQILNNLLSNAFKYTDSGEVKLTVKCVNTKDVCNLLFAVRDTGKGVKSEDINKLFNKFERLDTQMNSTVEGTGLGLAITKSLIEMMGGKINVESHFGKGTIFIVRLPQKIKTMTKPVVIESALKDDFDNEFSIDYGYKKVLIVDDNELNIKVAKRALQDFNFEIDSCNDGMQCIQKIKNGNEYDLILMDIMMPNMSGETALARLKENPAFEIPTIALTADAIAGAKEKYLSEGFVDYISKPFNKKQIKEKLDAILK